MKQKLLFSILLLFYLNAFGQKEYNVWYFGTKAGLTFNTNPPSSINNGEMSTKQASSGVCDESGNLLFYTDGDKVWNKNHQVMKNGTSSNNYYHHSGTQGAIVSKKTFTKDQYYVFCPASGETSGNPSMMSCVKYWLVDMTLDNGLGEVLEVNKPLLLPDALENVALTFHSDKKEIWVGALEKDKGRFNCIKTTNGVFGDTVVSSDVSEPESIILAKFSPDSRILYYGRSSSGPNVYRIHLYLFDNSTGRLSDELKIQTKDAAGHSAEFSHDSRFLYISFANRVVQYDLAVWNKEAVEKSAIEVNVNSTVYSGFHLGPDKKIYLFGTKTNYLSVIDSPYKKGLGCSPRSNLINLYPGEVSYGVPYFSTFYFRYVSVLLKSVSVFCENDSVVLSSKTSFGANIRWSTGDTTQTIVSKQPGWYWVMATLNGDTAIDSILVKVGKRPKVYIGSDTAFCGKFSHVLNAGSGKNNYQWSTGDTLVSILVNTPGVYSVTVKDTNSCEAGDTILIDQLLPPKLIVTDTLDCKHKLIRATPKGSGVHYLWNTGDTTESILADKEDVFSLVASNFFCSIKQAIDITNGCDMVYYIPNAFTPSGDGLNDVFNVTGENIEHVQMRVFNRWGEKLFDATGTDVSWDGKFSGKYCQQDVYVYEITLTGRIKGVVSEIALSGNVSLLR